ncbi:MAG: glycerol-3-phosphate acyltransferase PlsY [Candidatus Omnitrophota bacterium]|jgi:glycerol-3-phosphate acyltransferase PlsY
MILLGLILSYLIGSLPTAYIFGKQLKGFDIRDHGSGNMGATNVFRVLGKKPGIAVLIIDILKGVFAVGGLGLLLGITSNIGLILLGVASVCGHNWTIFLQFKGGKGIATSLGVLIGLTIQIASIRPVVCLTLLVWIGAFLISCIVSLSSIIAATFLPIAMLLTNQPLELICLGIIICVFVVIRHKANIKRLLEGQESRVPLYKKKH